MRLTQCINRICSNSAKHLAQVGSKLALKMFAMSSLVTLLLFVHASTAIITPEEYLGALKALKMDQDQMKVKISFFELKNFENQAEINLLKAKNADQDREIFKLKTKIDDQLAIKPAQPTTTNPIKIEPKKSLLLVNLLSEFQAKITENQTTNQLHEKRNPENGSKIRDNDEKIDVNVKLEITKQYEKTAADKLETKNITGNGENIAEPTKIKPKHAIDLILSRNETSTAEPSYNTTVKSV